MGEIFWAKATFLNFGDDLNLWLWPRLFPDFFTRESDDCLVGIGTILSRKLPREGRLFIMGSGAGYAAIPPDAERSNWHPVFVRGPLTARVLGLSKERSITDGAFLAADIFARPKTSPRGTIFIPHWKSELNGDWATVCGYAGLRHVSPMQPVEVVLSEIVAADLVVTESMHGAILADAFRVPWVPVRTSPETNDFKWIDWCMSVGETYEPEFIPPSSSFDAFRQAKANENLTEETFSISVDHKREAITLEEQLVGQFEQRFKSGGLRSEELLSVSDARMRRLISKCKDAATRFAFRKAALKPSVAAQDFAFKERAAIALSAAVKGHCRLSKDKTRAELHERLQAAVVEFKELTGDGV